MLAGKIVLNIRGSLQVVTFPKFIFRFKSSLEFGEVDRGVVLANQQLKTPYTETSQAQASEAEASQVAAFQVKVKMLKLRFSAGSGFARHVQVGEDCVSSYEPVRKYNAAKNLHKLNHLTFIELSVFKSAGPSWGALTARA